MLIAHTTPHIAAAAVAAAAPLASTVCEGHTRRRAEYLLCRGGSLVVIHDSLADCGADPDELVTGLSEGLEGEDAVSGVSVACA